MKSYFASKKATAAGTLIICVISIIFTLSSIYSIRNMESAASRIYEHPYTVSNSAREMRSRLLDMKQFISIFLTDSFHSIEDTEALLEARYALQQESLDKITEKYLGPADDTKKLQEKMDELIAEQSQLLYSVPDYSEAEINDYLNEYIYPIYDEVSETLTTITTFANQKVLALEKEMKYTSGLAISTAVLLSLFIIILSIQNSRHMERRRVHDVADREKMFDLLSNNVDDVFFIYNLKEKWMEYISPNCERILGLNEDQLQHYDAFTAKLSENDQAALYQLFHSGILRSQAEISLKMEGQGIRDKWLLLKAYPILVNDQVVRYIISIGDQTDALLAQQNLRDALTLAQKANDAKKDFLSRMSHEIRTPMNAIIGMATIAAANIHDQNRVEDCLAKIGFSSKHLLSLINDVLDMSKIEEGKLTMSHEPFEFRQLIQSITSIIDSQARSRNQNFEATVVDFTEEMVVGDAMRVNQILLNLLSNAVKFTPENGKIRLEVRQIGIRNNQVRMRFTVSDTGIGMNENFLQRLYMPFEQADSMISQRFGGTGLGMSITKNLVSLLGGTIQVFSKENEGTTFIVELSFERLDASALASTAERLNQLNVLVVDDDQDTCIHTSLLLERMGILAKWVLKGEEAVKIIIDAHGSDNEYDVCFIDWQMPDMDGIETARRIRKYVGADTLIIIISAYDWTPIEQAAREAGVNAFISKPMFASTIYNTLMTVTRRPAYEKPEEKETVKPRELAGKRVLLVEDNELNMEIATEILKMADVKVECVHNGREAVDQVLNSEADYYDLVLMDIQMPVMNGYEATQAIRNSNHPNAKSLPILAMTANAFVEDIALAKEAGMNAHIAKPIDVSQLYTTLTQILQETPDGDSDNGVLEN